MSFLKSTFLILSIRKLSEAIEALCQPCTLAAGVRRADLGVVYSGLIKPCLIAKTSVPVYRMCDRDSWTVSVKFHDHSNLVISDFFTGLGYILSSQAYGLRSLSERIELLALYAKICKLSSPLVQSRPPTTVQLLWVNSPHKGDNRLALGSSLAWLKVRSHFQMARAVREGILRDIWGSTSALINPTPMQTCFPNPVGALFGSCWGDCAEAISLSAFWKLVASGAPLGTLAFNVASMNAVDPAIGLSACDIILENAGKLTLQKIFEVLTRAGAFRPMCKNCEHLRDAVAANIVDCAHPEFWLELGYSEDSAPHILSTCESSSRP
ncbi:hypothetical protein GGX14DRAFT_646337 [Mycena pura]|uniref:LAGLIDADG endonuclease n=1 Tax=Mycena pura TaxID=153505 RepID=A0AAD6V7P4_9AGAR|nr:hypothetical protein GGX14DRAFT_646337 [Mycena pura]